MGKKRKRKNLKKRSRLANSFLENNRKTSKTGDEKIMKMKKWEEEEEGFLIYILGVLVALIAIILALAYMAEAQTVTQEQARNAFAPCNHQTSFERAGFSWTDSNGQVVTEYITPTIGCMRAGVSPFSISNLRQDAERIPTASLMKEHVDMCFQQLIRTQTELSNDIGVYETYQKLNGETCMLSDTTCNGTTAITLVNIRDYWISPFAVERTTQSTPTPPSREDYLLHFQTCIGGLDFWLAWRDWVRNTLTPIKQNEVAGRLEDLRNRRRSTTAVTSVINNIRR